MEVRTKKGDSIWRIAKAYKPESVSTAEFVQQILDLNELDDPDKISIGQIIQIPGEAPPEPTTRADAQQRVADREALRERAYADPSRRDDTNQPQVRPATAEEVKKYIRDAETRREEATLTDLVANLSERFGNVRVSTPMGNAPPEVEQRYHPVPAQKRELSTVEEIGSAMGINPGKDQSRIPAVEPLDLDVLGLTPFRPPPPPYNPLPEYSTLPKPRPAYVAQAATLPSYPGRASFTVGDPGGLLEEGNINLDERPVVDNGDGTYSTVKSASFEEDGIEVLVPTLDPTGRQMSDEEAYQRYRDTGEFLGKFDTPDSATAYAKRLSLRQNKLLPSVNKDFIDLNAVAADGNSSHAAFLAARESGDTGVAYVTGARGVMAPNYPADAGGARPDPSRRPVKRVPPNPQWLKQTLDAVRGPVFQPTKVK